jgi:hypothetical protein
MDEMLVLLVLALRVMAMSQKDFHDFLVVVVTLAGVISCASAYAYACICAWAS